MFYHKQIIGGIFLAMLFGCNNQQEAQPSENNMEKVKYTQIHTTHVNETIANYAKETIIGMEEVTEVQAVQFKDSIYIAAKPQHHERFQLEKLKKKIKTTLEEIYPNMEIHVSVDKKISMLLGELEHNIQDKEITEDEIDKKLKKIRTEMKSDT